MRKLKPSKTYGRKKPYTLIGLQRLKCIRCGSKAFSQWTVCSNKNKHVPICWPCDIKLNHLALEFMRIKPKDLNTMMNQYVLSK